jgi:hypothetical protein
MLVISGFRCNVDEICALLGCYAASNGNPLRTFGDKLSGPIVKDQEVFFILEGGTYRLSRNVGKGLLLDAA